VPADCRLDNAVTAPSWRDNDNDTTASSAADATNATATARGACPRIRPATFRFLPFFLFSLLFPYGSEENWTRERGKGPVDEHKKNVFSIDSWNISRNWILEY
jgi:hypothetical protein